MAVLLGRRTIRPGPPFGDFHGLASQSQSSFRGVRAAWQRHSTLVEALRPRDSQEIDHDSN
jgi:hypothetical protein